MANHSRWQAPDEFRLETELDEIASLGVEQDFIGAIEGALPGGETNRGFAKAAADDLLQTTESAADNEEDMLRIDGRRCFAPALREIHHGLDLAGNIVGGTRGHFRFLHELQEVGLDAASAHVAPVEVGR